VERLQVVQLATRDDHETWTVLQATLGQRGSDDHERGTSLLPLPDDARPIALRRDEQQRVIGEVSLFRTEVARLLAMWHSQGWHVDRSEATADRGQHLICHREGETRYVWLQRDADHDEGFLLVVRG
jgi:hypothetical protein